MWREPCCGLCPPCRGRVRFGGAGGVPWPRCGQPVSWHLGATTTTQGKSSRVPWDFHPDKGGDPWPGARLTLCKGCVAVDPRSHSPHCLGPARPLRWHRARPRGLCLRWGHAGAPAASVRGGGCPRGLAQAGWAGGSRVPPFSAGPPGCDCPEQGSWGPLSPLCAPQSCGGRGPPLRELQRWVDVGPLPWLGHLGALVMVTVTWRARGRRALAGLPGSVPRSRRHTRCRVSPARGVPARAALSGVGAAVLCLSFLRASCGCARWPRGAGC